MRSVGLLFDREVIDAVSRHLNEVETNGTALEPVLN